MSQFSPLQLKTRQAASNLAPQEQEAFEPAGVTQRPARSASDLLCSAPLLWGTRQVKGKRIGQISRLFAVASCFSFALTSKFKSSRFFKVLQGSSRFFKVLQGSSRFFKVLQGSSRFFKVLLFPRLAAHGLVGHIPIRCCT